MLLLHGPRAVGHRPVGLHVLLLLHLAVIKLLHISHLLLLIYSLHRMQGSELIALRLARVSASLSWGLMMRFTPLRPAWRQLNRILLSLVHKELKLLGLMLILIPVRIGWGGLGRLDLHRLKGGLQLVKVTLTCRGPGRPQRSTHGERLLGLLGA